MPQFMIVPYDAASSATTAEQPLLRRYSTWTNSLARHGVLRGGKRLRADGGRLLCRTGDELSVIAASQPGESARIGGFWIVEADDYEQAVHLVADCPHLDVGPLVIREVVQR